MGVMSRRVLPACGSLCFFCPSLRARSRQPVKRYKKMLAEIFPRNQEAEPNDRKIGKLCEYASKNPLRIPKITNYLEQRCYKDLRNGNTGSVKVVLCVYRKLLSSCKEQMPLYSSSLLSIVRTLLEQTRQEEMQILGCNTLVEFINFQIDSTCMFHLEGLIPKLCQLAQEVGDNERALRLRSAGMHALAFMVSFMGEHSHISMDFDTIVSAILENYMGLQMTHEHAKEHGQNSQIERQWVQGVSKDKENGSSFPDMSKKVSFKSNFVTGCDLENVDTSKSPSYWSMACLCNIARLAKEATTVRRVLEPLFHTFDAGNHWSPEKGVASSVLLYLQSLLEESGENSHLLLSTLIKHLDHKNVAKRPLLQVNIVNVTTCLAQDAKQQASVTITSTIADLIKHLRKCLQNLAESSSPAGENNKQNFELQSALEKCIAEFSNKVSALLLSIISLTLEKLTNSNNGRLAEEFKTTLATFSTHNVGDVGPILDIMAVVLENIYTNVVIARTTISAVLRTAHIVSTVPNISYYKQVLPDALFHQLLLAMAHTDHETRVGAHSIFSVVLLRSLVLPWSDQDKKSFEAVSGIISVNASQTVRSESFSFQDEEKDKTESVNGGLEEGHQISGASLTQSTRPQIIGQSYSFKAALADGKKSSTSLRLSSRQVSLLLSSIWVQATSADNTPANFEAMAHTYNIALLFTRAKTSSHMALARCFQLAFSLRNISLDQAGGLRPSCRRSLFTLATYMLIFSASVGNLQELIPQVKATLTDKTVDPYLELAQDSRLQAVGRESDKERMIAYGSDEDDISASRSLSTVESDDSYLKETVISHFTTKCETLSEDELSSIKKQILLDFSTDDAYPIGAPLFMETPRPGSPLAQIECPAFEEVELSTIVTDEETSPDPNGSQSGRRTSLSTNTADILSVNELLESVSETARQVASFPVSSIPIPYDQMKSQCEALVSGKQQKMSVLQSLKQREAKALNFTDDNEKKDILLLNTKTEGSEDDLKLTTVAQLQPRNQLSLCSREYGQNSFRLPPSSPYDKFLKAAGC